MSSLARRKRNFIIAALVIPTVLLICFVVFPTIDLFKMSFTNWGGILPSNDFIWFDNHKSMFHSVDLWQSLGNSMVYFVIHLCVIPVELAFAVLLTSRLKAAKFCKIMIFMLYIINGVATSYAFSCFLSPVNGAFDAILKVLHMGMLSGKGWLSAPGIASFVLSFVSLWRFSGYHVILFMTALQSLPQDVQEATRVDGANTWQIFRLIQVPAIMLMVNFVLFDNIRGSFQAFDIPSVITSGDPGYASSTFTLYTTETAFSYSNFGLTSTMAVAIMVMILVIYLVQNKITHRIVLKGGK